MTNAITVTDVTWHNHDIDITALAGIINGCATFHQHLDATHPYHFELTFNGVESSLFVAKVKAALAVICSIDINYISTSQHGYCITLGISDSNAVEQIILSIEGYQLLPHLFNDITQYCDANGIDYYHGLSDIESRYMAGHLLSGGYIEVYNHSYQPSLHLNLGSGVTSKEEAYNYIQYVPTSYYTLNEAGNYTLSLAGNKSLMTNILHHATQLSYNYGGPHFYSSMLAFALIGITQRYYMPLGKVSYGDEYYVINRLAYLLAYSSCYGRTLVAINSQSVYRGIQEKQYTDEATHLYMMRSMKAIKAIYDLRKSQGKFISEVRRYVMSTPGMRNWIK